MSKFYFKDRTSQNSRFTVLNSQDQSRYVPNFNQSRYFEIFSFSPEILSFSPEKLSFSALRYGYETSLILARAWNNFPVVFLLVCHTRTQQSFSLEDLDPRISWLFSSALTAGKKPKMFWNGLCLKGGKTYRR